MQRIPHVLRIDRPQGSEHTQSASPAPAVTQLCKLNVTGELILATPAQRKKAGEIALPPLTDQANGFAWPDTELGVIKTDSGYAFFGSDGGYHRRQDWEDKNEGNNKYGSVTRTLGALDNPLGSEAPIDVTIKVNPDPAVNPFYASYDYMGGGPVYRVPKGLSGAGNLLMVYHAEIPTVTTQSFDSILALACSSPIGTRFVLPGTPTCSAIRLSSTTAI
jgi:hypothetical protein